MNSRFIGLSILFSVVLGFQTATAGIGRNLLVSFAIATTAKGLAVMYNFINDDGDNLSTFCSLKPGESASQDCWSARARAVNNFASSNIVSQPCIFRGTFATSFIALVIYDLLKLNRATTPDKLV